MMASSAVIGLGAGKNLLPSSAFICPPDVSEKLCFANNDYGGSSPSSALGPPPRPHLFTVNSKKASSSSYSSHNYDFNGGSGGNVFSSKRIAHSVEALSENVQRSDQLEEDTIDPDYFVDALLLLQKSMLEKQWSLTFETPPSSARRVGLEKSPVACSGISARQRRISARRRKNHLNPNSSIASEAKSFSIINKQISPELLQNRLSGYVKGDVSEKLLTHVEVVDLSKNIRAGLHLEDSKFRLKEIIGYEPSDDQLASYLRISRAELQSRLIQCSLAREKLAMGNVRLVMSIARRYENMGVELPDLVQGGLIGLVRGVEKFDSSKGFKISTYVYWWIRQGVTKALVENSRTLRLPSHLHERLHLIKNAKIELEGNGITPSIDKIAENLNISRKKVRNATEADDKVFSLDKEAYPSLNGHPGESLHSYTADPHPENNPWHGVDNWALKDEVNKLLDATLGTREQYIIRLYHGLGSESLTWEDISKRVGLSRERVRQIGLVAMEKLKHAARRRRMEAMLVKN